MTQPTPANLRNLLDTLYRDDSRRVLATLLRLLGDFDLAEEALHEAFRAALEQWPVSGVPLNPRAWLVSTGRFKAIDGLRRQARFQPLDAQTEPRAPDDGPDDGVDDRLRLIFICCHPALTADAQVALTLREVCGLSTEEIARAFLIRPATVAQRIVRAKGKIRDARLPYAVPDRAELPQRLDAVLRVIYLVFNEGYCASTGEALMRHQLSGEAIRLARLLLELLPDAEVMGLLALMLFAESRSPARVSASGERVLLADQDRSRWHHGLIVEAQALLLQTLRSGRFGAYSVQAAIAAVHAEAAEAKATDWAQIVGLYDVLLRLSPSPVVELNHAVAVAMAHGAAAGLRLIDALLARGELRDYHLAHAARADLQRRLGQTAAARAAYSRALALVGQGPDRQFIEARLNELAAEPDTRVPTTAGRG